jgi:glycosyltransferase involved in cell wall biosynthesis
MDEVRDVGHVRAVGAVGEMCDVLLVVGHGTSLVGVHMQARNGLGLGQDFAQRARPTVSVLIPAHERPALLAEAVASACRQTYPAEAYEVVVVHDGLDAPWLPPHDPTPPVLRVHAIPRRGQGAAVNAAAALARGGYLTVLQDDDTMLPHKLAVLVTALEADPAVGGAYSLPVYVEADGVTPRWTPPKLRSWLLTHPRVTPRGVARHGLYLHGMGTMFRRAAWQETGPWDEALTAGEEWEWHLRYFVTGHSLVAVDSVTTTYRHHAAQKSGRRCRGLASRRAVVEAIRARHRDAFAALRAQGDGS